MSVPGAEASGPAMECACGRSKRTVETMIPKVAVAKLQYPLPKEEIEKIWQEEQASLPHQHPDFVFDVDGDEVRISISPRHSLRIPIDEVKRPFQIAIHRKYPAMKIEWLDGPLPPLPVR